jgi:hypothetical protein
VHGDCPTGADAFADQFARDFGIQVEKHKAEWDLHGKFAGPKRNKEMVDLGADVVLAFPQGLSKGTRGTIRMAETAGLPIIVRELILGDREDRWTISTDFINPELIVLINYKENDDRQDRKDRS